MSDSFSKRLGETLARLQDLLDTALHLGIKRVAESGDNHKSEQPRKKSRAERLLRFLVEIGDSYFRL